MNRWNQIVIGGIFFQVIRNNEEVIKRDVKRVIALNQGITEATKP